MVVSAHEVGFSDADLQGELQELRYRLLDRLKIAGPVLGLGWLFYAMCRDWPIGVPLGAVFLIIGGGLAAHRASSRQHYSLACWILLGSLALSIGMFTTEHPRSLVPASGVIVIIAANALLGPGRAAIVTIASGLCVTLACALVLGEQTGYALAPEILALYAITTAAAWLAMWPLDAAAKLALEGWSQARSALLEVRGRRADLYRVVRALEEATYRIERMNSELILAQRDAAEARALKARFVAAVSHELRSPLNLVLGFSSLMVLSPESYGEPLPAPYRRDIYAIYQNCQHLLSLVNDILDLSQIEAQKMPLVKDRIDMAADVIERAADIVRPLAERKGLSLHIETPGDLAWVLVDPVRLRQVLLNLLTNAVRLTERGGISVCATQTQESIIVSVSDTGPGIPESDIPKLFREFSQLESSDGEKGAGLGLAIGKHLVELHGGQIWVQSEPGLGTTFSFSVPLPGAQSIRPDLVRSDAARGSASSERNCLVIHPDPDIVRLLARHLAGYRTVGLANNEHVEQFVQDLHPKAIISTPELGREALRELARASLNVPAILCAMPGAMDEDHLSDVAGYLTKPVTADAMHAMLQQIPNKAEATILLVDDDPDAVRLLSQMLTALPHPYTILSAYGGEHALSLMADHVPDVVFLDMLMPGIDGRQVLAQMRGNPILSRVPVIVVSGQDWIEESTRLGRSIHLEHLEALSITEGIACIQGLLDGLRTDYLSSRSGSPHEPGRHV